MDGSNRRINLQQIEDELSDNQQSFREQNKPHSSGSEIKTMNTSLFPDLVILFTSYCKNNYDPHRDINGVDLVNRCLIEFNYEPLNVEYNVLGSTICASVTYNGNVLAKGQGSSYKEAKLEAGAHLTQFLRTTHYSIEPKRTYFTTKKMAVHVLKVDPSQSHIYKVVCLGTPSDLSEPLIFKERVTGSVDYVNSERELWMYIDNHVNSVSDADLYVLNVDTKPAIRKVKTMYGTNDIFGRRLLGSSNRGIVISRKENIPKIFEELKKCGGENIKYRLIPPGGKLGENSYTSDKNANVNDNEEAQCEVMTKETEKQIEVPQWIANKLILMDFFDRKGAPADPYHQLLFSVNNCPDIGEFMIEKKLDKNTSLHTCEALIDRKLVGIGRAYLRDQAKDMAAQNALENLKDCCVSIKVKPSYLVCNGHLPRILTEKNPPGENTIFRVVDPKEATSEREFYKVLQQFKNSKLQDLFFLQNFSNNDMKLVISMAKDMRLQSWLIGNICACVYKKRRSKELYEELRKAGGEDEKYKVLKPLRKLNKLESATKQNQDLDKESQIRKLFDIDGPNVDVDNHQQSKPNQGLNKELQIKKLFDIDGPNIDLDDHKQSLSNQAESDTASQTTSSRQFESTRFDNIPFKNKINQHCASTERCGGSNIKEESIYSGSQLSFRGQRPLEQRHAFNEGSEGFKSRNNKRSYFEGPGSREEGLSRYSQSSHTIQRPTEHSHNINEGSEAYNARNDKRPYFEGLGREEGLSRYSQPSYTIQRPTEHSYNMNEGSEVFNSRNNKRPYIEGPGSREEGLSRYSQPYTTQRPQEHSHNMNEGSEASNSRNDKRPYFEGLGREEGLSRYSQPSYTIQRPQEHSHNMNEGSEASNSRNNNRPYFEGPGHREEGLSRYSQPSYTIQRKMHNEGSDILHNQSYNSEEQDGKLFQRQNYFSNASGNRYDSDNSKNVSGSDMYSRQTLYK